MGSLHARSIAASDRAELGQIVDLDPARAAKLAARHGGVAASPVSPINADAVVIATPTERHVDLACDLLGRGVPVLVEKPIAPDPAGLERVLGAATVTNTVLMCGFVERFNPVIVAMSDLLEEPMVHFVSVRHSPPTPRAGSSVASDLLIHDVDLAVRLQAMHAGDISIDAESSDLPKITGSMSTGNTGSVETEVADCTLRFSDGSLATLSASRIGQRKIREIRIMTAGTQYELDLLRHDITIYRNVHQGEGRDDASYRSETVIEIPFVKSHQEPLASQLDHFCDLIDGSADPAVERAGIWMPHQLIYRLGSDSEHAGDPAIVLQ